MVDLSKKDLPIVDFQGNEYDNPIAMIISGHLKFEFYTHNEIHVTDLLQNRKYTLYNSLDKEKPFVIQLIKKSEDDGIQSKT